MQFFSTIDIKRIDPPINYNQKILLAGSCFTEHIGNFLADRKFDVLQNPNGILFDPLSLASSLISYTQNKQYSADDLFYFNETWNSWQYHSRFSNPDKETCLLNINQSQKTACNFLKEADWLIITLGSAFTYKLVETNNTVANCHKAAAQNFNKHLNSIEEIITAFDIAIHQLFHFNNKLKIIFTISPVRHLRDGVIDNNRSKARLIEATHHLVNKFERLYYFPAYEIVIDVLRDYRFYDIDLAHPNYAATQFVLEKFTDACFNDQTKKLMEEIKKLITAKTHKPFNKKSELHKNFLAQQLVKAKQIQIENPDLNLSEEMEYFSG